VSRISYKDLPTYLRAEIESVFQDPTGKDAKAAKRKRQRYREPTGRPKGRPRLTEAQAIESAESRRAYMREYMMRRKKRALLAK
jgi:hypothetical protein